MYDEYLKGLSPKAKLEIYRALRLPVGKRSVSEINLIISYKELQLCDIKTFFSSKRRQLRSEIRSLKVERSKVITICNN